MKKTTCVCVSIIISGLFFSTLFGSPKSATGQSPTGRSIFASSGFLTRAGAVPEVFSGFPAARFNVGSATTCFLYDPTNGKDEIRIPVYRWRIFRDVVGILHINKSEIYLDGTIDPKDSFHLPLRDIQEIKINRHLKKCFRVELKAKDEKIPISVNFEGVPLVQAIYFPIQELLVGFIHFAIQDFDGAVGEVLALTSEVTKSRAEKLKLLAEDARIRDERFQKALQDGDPAIDRLSPEAILVIRNGVKLLRKLVAATEVGVTFEEYSKLTIDAKAELEEVLETIPDSDLREEIRLSLSAFVDAKLVWNESIRYDFILADSEIGKYLKAKYGFEPSTISLSSPKFYNRAPLLNEIWRMGKLRLDRANQLISKLTKQKT